MRLADWRPGTHRWEVSEMSGKQIEFQENHTHKKSYERGMLILSLVCIVFVIIAVNVVSGPTCGEDTWAMSC